MLLLNNLNPWSRGCFGLGTVSYCHGVEHQRSSAGRFKFCIHLVHAVCIGEDLCFLHILASKIPSHSKGICFLNRANSLKYLFGLFNPTLERCLFTWPLLISIPESLGRDKQPTLCFFPHQLMIIKTLPFIVFTQEISEQTNNLGTIKQKLSARYINTTVILAHSWLNAWQMFQIWS